MSKQSPEQKPDEDERGSLARPPWLTGEKKRRRVQIGRGKRHEDADEPRDRPVKSEQETVDTGPQRVPVSRRGPDAESEAPAERSDETPEIRPKRVAVPFDRTRRLQQPEPEPAPPAPQQIFAPVPHNPAADAEVSEVTPDEEPELPFAPDQVPPASEPIPEPVPEPMPKPVPPIETAPESVEWVSEALARLEWQYDSLLAESLVKPEAPSEPTVDSECESAAEVSAEPDPESVIEVPSEIAGAAHPDPEPELAEVLPPPEPSAETELDVEFPGEPVAPLSVSAAAFAAEPDFELRDEPELPETATEAEPSSDVSEPRWDPPPTETEAVVEVSAEQVAEPESDGDHSIELAAPVLNPEDVVEDATDFELREEPELPATVTEPPPVLESEPVALASEPEWVAPPLPEPEAVVEISAERGWTPEDEPAPVEPEPAEESTQESGSGELDEIELRAAALLDRMAAKRAQATGAPQEPEVDLIADDERDAEGPDRIPVAPTKEFGPPPEEEHAAEALPTQWLPADLVGDVQQAAVEPKPDAEPLDDDAVVAPTESFVAAQPTEDVQETAPVARERTKEPRRPAPPPWQTPSSAMAAEIEEVVMDAPVAQQEPVPESHEPPTQQGPLIPGPRPPAPPSPPRKRPRTGARPPFPPPPPPGPFPPPPWWPGPRPGQRVPPSARPAASAAPLRAPQPAPPPGRPQPPPGGPPQGYQPFRMPPSIDEAEIANPDRFAPPSGWRRAVHKATGGHVNPGASRKERQQDHLLAEIRQPIVGDFRIAVLSIKGGVGKTTTTFGLGSALATVRHDRVIAVDANPDRGTLGERVGDLSTRSTVRDLLSDPNINRYADVRNHTLMATSRLEVLASEQDPAVSEVFGADDYRRTVDILRHYYNIILTDCGTGIMHSAMSAVLDLAHTIVLVSSPAIDAARSASATLDWLMQHGHSGLVREAHVVLSASRPGSAALKLDKVYEHFQSRCRSIHLIPFDPHLAEGADVDFGRLNPATRQAYLELAGSVAENFGRLRAPREQS
ncbi:AAA family ATPase [Mycobacterium sp. Z3061]|uniref:nucleotide-binding protein n=1 Tax=Mycobacterium sp. Z3061 TaxID=3073562 RepID=UPI002873E76F|nr:AAA family ATPase [Mycobacterium sp. Z3061]